jgi:hypothetical protein
VVAVLVARAVLAQDFELDLSEEKPKVPAELKPSIAVLSVIAGDAEESSLGRARQLESEVLKQLVQSDEFQTVVEPGNVVKNLGAQSSVVQKCVDYACFDGAIKALKTNRAVRFVVAKSGAGSVITVFGFDPAITAVLQTTFDSQEKAEKIFLGFAGKSQAQKDREFLKKAAPFIKDTLSKLATANGKISVDNNEQSAVSQVDGVEAGTGSLEVVVQRGAHTVKVLADGFLPFEQTVTVEPMKTATVKVSLVAKPVEVKQVAKVEPPSDTFFKRPGLYLAAGGVVAAAVGVVLGQSASSVTTRIKAGGDPLPVTRAEAKAAQTNAILADVLVGVGAALVAGGVTWIVLTPTVGPVKKPTIEPGESSGVNGAVLSFSGTF